MLCDLYNTRALLLFVQLDTHMGMHAHFTADGASASWPAEGTYSGGHSQKLAIRTPGNTEDCLTNWQLNRLSLDVLDLSPCQIEDPCAAASRHNCTSERLC